MARLYADEHIPVQVTYKLRRLGHQVLTVKETNQNKYGDRVPDEHILAFATLDNRAVLTENRSDFCNLHKRFPGHKGILVSKRFDDFGKQAKLIDEAIKAVIGNSGSLSGQYITIPHAEDDLSRPVPLKRRSRDRH